MTITTLDKQKYYLHLSDIVRVVAPHLAWNDREGGCGVFRGGPAILMFWGLGLAKGWLKGKKEQYLKNAKFYIT